MTEQKQETSRNYRRCGAKCCGNCKWFMRAYEETWCEHPKNVIDEIYEEYVAGPYEDHVCDWWETAEENGK